ncbi:WD40 repeat-like protein [Wallemia mellicola CBS 633.66]|uniref:WD40 repeat-like protein n=1 Tax=Wallemia mellicola (strain ATCC MYA-4683 / CBS 633.66) TaxID=671144 RepID=I4Y9E8_WALMC|nr:WD40 repeat-like protein [Wallemia mellicola CBS 633.66]EIM20590.1 WD40 repeat-like protein [Wallemia mellicola CBS 633.66]|eukprot:XP_006959380.1 WD40 repeat-like protein [Wallemia mellicola CBS 633.66]
MTPDKRSRKSDRFIPSRTPLSKVSYNLDKAGLSDEKSSKPLSEDFFNTLGQETLAAPTPIETTTDANENEDNRQKRRRKSLSMHTTPPRTKVLQTTTQGMLQTRSLRRVSHTPKTVLDAPYMADDQYCNLMSWSCEDVLAVALQSHIYTWRSSHVSMLCDVQETSSALRVASLAWDPTGKILAVGLDDGTTQLWDVQQRQCIGQVCKQSAKVGVINWSSGVLACGSRDGSIFVKDTRMANTNLRLRLHKGEITSLTYSAATEALASGGNDNKLYLWDIRSRGRLLKSYTDHEGAVTALSFNPHHRGVLASGGGTYDRRIVFRDTIHQGRKTLGDYDTGSQVCNLYFSTNTQELLSTHGFSQYSRGNLVCLWQYPSMKQIASIRSHLGRPIYMGVSSDGTTVATGSGDETIRFWKLFPPRQENKPESVFNLTKYIR